MSDIFPSRDQAPEIKLLARFSKHSQGDYIGEPITRLERSVNAPTLLSLMQQLRQHSRGRTVA